MLDLAGLPHRARSFIAKAFYRFGIHCASHPKRVILISGVVILSLFYPAKELYFSSNPHSLNSIQALFSSNQFELREIWEGNDAIYVLEDSAVRARCGSERTLRVERVLVPPMEMTPSGAATAPTLHFASKLINRINETLKQDDRLLGCIRANDGNCFVISPFSFFPKVIPPLSSDILDTINSATNVTMDGIPVDTSMVFALWRDEYPDAPVQHVSLLALTYFFVEKDCSNQEGHIKWLSLLERASSSHSEPTSLIPFVEKPKYFVLQNDPTHSRPSHFNLVFVLLNIAIIGIFYSLSGSLRRMTGVHSRFGLTCTAAVECCASTMASISVCSLARLRLTMVPWTVHLVLVVFIGAENMFLLVDKVTSTSVTLLHKQRIGTGLASAGTTITLNTVAYNSILGVIAAFTSGAIREFCIFAIVLLVAHWFLVHTLFIAVLSVDLQRLELSDVLSQDKASKPVVLSKPQSPTQEAPKSKRRRAINRVQQRLRVIPSKNGSLLLMLAVTAILYYVTYPFQSRPSSETETLHFLQNVLRRPASQPDTTLSSSFKLWKVLNPENDPFLHVRIENPIVVVPSVKGSAETLMNAHQDLRSQGWLIRRMIWLFKKMVLPIAATTGCLYLFLLYLLRGAEQLEAYRTRPFDIPKVHTPSLGDKVTFSTLPRVFPTDVSHIATNHDASVIAIVSTKSDIVVWRDGYNKLNVRDVLTSGYCGSATQGRVKRVALDRDGSYCAIGTDRGVLAIWQIPPNGVQLDSIPHFVAFSLSVPIVDIYFLPSSSTLNDGATSLPETTPAVQRLQDFSVLLLCEDASVHQASPMSNSGTEAITPSHDDNILKSHLLRNSDTDEIYVAFSFQDGYVELMGRVWRDTWMTICIVPAGAPTDPVTQLSLTSFKQDNDEPNALVLAAATKAGVVSVYNAEKAACIHLFENAFGEINKLRVSSISPQKCQICGILTPNALAVAFSVGTTVFVYRAKQNAMLDRCTCAVSHKPFLRDSLGRRSRSGSTTSVISSSPPKVRSRLSSLSLGSELANFPVSPHGVHSRRAGSERELGRRTSGSFSKISNKTETGEASGTLSTGNGYSSSVESTVELVADVDYERGGWDLVDGHRLLGIRRRPRLQQQQNGLHPSEAIQDAPQKLPPAPHGDLPASVLDRWELWTLDPGHPEYDVRTSTLLSLSSADKRTTPSFGGDFPRLPFTRVSPLWLRSTVCVAGFGNTTGIIDLSELTT